MKNGYIGLHKIGGYASSANYDESDNTNHIDQNCLQGRCLPKAFKDSNKTASFNLCLICSLTINSSGTSNTYPPMTVNYKVTFVNI